MFPVTREESVVVDVRVGGEGGVKGPDLRLRYSMFDSISALTISWVVSYAAWTDVVDLFLCL